MNFLSSFSAQLDELEEEGKFNEISTNILNLMVRNIDLSPIAGKVIKLLAVPSPSCKKVLYSFLSRFSISIADLSILATNSLLKDMDDPNPFIRRLVINTACSISSLSDLALELLPKALNDSHPYVRSSAATASSVVITAVNLKDNQDIVNKLYELIRDNDASVICSSISALDVILQSDGGIIVNSRMFFYLLSRLIDFNEWHLSAVSKVFKKYVPKSEEELLRILNTLDEKLRDTNIHVSSLATDLALHFVNTLKTELSQDILHQVIPQFRTLLCHSNQDVLIATLQVIENFMPEHQVLFKPLYNLFFCCFNDFIVTKCKKLKILPYLVSKTALSSIAEEILLNCCNAEKEVSTQAMFSFIELLSQDLELSSYLDSFVSLMDIQFNNLSEDIFIALSEIDLQESPVIRDCVFVAVTQQAENFLKPKSKESILRLIGNYGKYIENSPCILEKLLIDESYFENEKHFSMLLSSAFKLFIQRPGEMQLLLGYILQRASRSNCVLLRKQVFIYNSLLRNLSSKQEKNDLFK